MAGKTHHIEFAEANEQLALQLLGSDDPAARRWGVVVAYYSVLHLLHAGAADRSNHPDEHSATWRVVTDFDPMRTQLRGQVHELYNLSHKARYLKNEGNTATDWFVPLWRTEEQAIDQATTLLRTLVPELRRLMNV